MNVLPIEIINQEAFLPFGDIIEKANSNKKLTINQGTTIRHSEISKLNLNTNNGESYISIFSGEPRKFPIEIKILEKHPLATQTFLPIQNFDWLVVVAEEKNNAPNLESLRCFKINSEYEKLSLSFNENIFSCFISGKLFSFHSHFFTK